MLKETKDQNVKHSRFNLENFQMKAWQPLLKILLNDFGWMKMTFRLVIIALKSNFYAFLKFVSNQDRNFGMMAGNALGLTAINSGQGSVGMRETCGRYPTFDGSCNHEDNGGK